MSGSGLNQIKPMMFEVLGKSPGQKNNVLFWEEIRTIPRVNRIN
jgi:hypothetical protein